MLRHAEYLDQKKINLVEERERNAPRGRSRNTLAVHHPILGG